jgi:hypothetical protein
MKELGMCHSTPKPRMFKGGQNMWTKMRFGALECAGLTSPPAPLPFWERGGQNMWANSVFEALGCAVWLSPPNPLSQNGSGGTGRIRKRPISFRTWVLSALEPEMGAG